MGERYRLPVGQAIRHPRKCKVPITATAGRPTSSPSTMASVASANRFAALANAPTSSSSPKSAYKPPAPEPSPAPKPVKENGKPAEASRSNDLRSRSTKVNGSANGSAANGHAHSNGVANGAANIKSAVKAKAKKQVAAIDWEIPRKTLHSSIGES